MRLRFLATTFAILFVSLACHAESITVTPVDNSGSFEFNFNPATDVRAINPNADIVYNAVASGAIGNFHTILVLYNAASGGPEFGYYAPNLIDFYSYAGPVLYSGPEASPTFHYGTYHVIGIESEPDAAVLFTTPEPSSLFLLGTGLLGTIGEFRRRSRA